MEYTIGMIGLGVMGRNLLLNMADNGFHVAGFDKDLTKVEALLHESEGNKVHGAKTLQEFLDVLQKPRAIMLLIPAGPPVDSVIDELIPLLQPGDLIIDAGNSYYKDTIIRAKKLAAIQIEYFGMGISGGEEGARKGPSLMPGGNKKDYDRIQKILEAVAAKVDNEPCVAYLGPGSVGHFVKMVHNGIEYGIMQLIAETYDLMKRGLQLDDGALHEIYRSWNNSELNSYLLEITAGIFCNTDNKTGKNLIDEILDVAKQNGTGKWTSQNGMDMQVPMPTIDLAVDIRNLSMLEQQRKGIHELIHRPIQPFRGDPQLFLKQLQKAFYVSTIVTYAQGMALLSAASQKLNANLNLETVARIWRGGCIIRASLLEDIRKAYKKDPQLSNLLLDKELAKRVNDSQEDLRQIISYAASMGIPVSCLMASLSYIDAFSSSWLPANLIQAQRDFFGAHTYERIDAKGTFHTKWVE